jgi:hypothetical protein
MYTSTNFEFRTVDFQIDTSKDNTNTKQHVLISILNKYRLQLN